MRAGQLRRLALRRCGGSRRGAATGVARRQRLQLPGGLGRRVGFQSVENILEGSLCLLGRFGGSFGGINPGARLARQHFAVAGGLGIACGHARRGCSGPAGVRRLVWRGRAARAARRTLAVHMGSHAAVDFLFPIGE